MKPKFKVGDVIFHPKDGFSGQITDVITRDKYPYYICEVISYGTRLEKSNSHIQFSSGDVWSGTINHIDKEYHLYKDAFEEHIRDHERLFEKEGQRHDAGKIELTQCPVEAIAAISAVLMLNSEKYGGKYADKNWQLGMPFSKTVNPALRHIYKRLSGETVDSESGLPHSWHALTDLAFLVVYEMSHPENDDLGKSGGENLQKITEMLNSVMQERNKKNTP